jgi:starch synthase (maltosyl-transferring)
VEATLARSGEASPVKLGPRIYNLFPKLVGPVERWIEHLPRIAAMGFDWVYLNPFHETGFSGSLYAVKDHYRLNPIFRSEAKAGDDDLLRGFVEAAGRHGIAVMMDLVVNHTARDAKLAREHPQWFAHEADGSVRSPRAVDPDDPDNVTVWTDLAELDYAPRPERAGIVAYFAGVVRHYAQLGFRGFRCDAAYKVPGDVWGELIAAARPIRPDSLFAAETLGCRIEEVEQLGSAGFDFLFNSAKWWDFREDWLLEQYDRFRHIAPSIAFPESHDTPRLVSELGDRPAEELAAEYRFRYLFSAFFSSGVMMPIGYEFGFSKALDVVTTSPEDWELPRFDLSAFIAQANATKASIPALNQEGAERRFTRAGAMPVGLLRDASAGSSYALALLNPDAAAPAVISGEDLSKALDGHGTPLDVTPAVEQRAVIAPYASLLLQPLEMRIFAADNHRQPPLEGPELIARAARPVAIEAVWPQIDAGRFPVKRIVGQRLEVQADIFRDGHDSIAAVLQYREQGVSVWRETPMVLFDNDRWSGAFELERNARYEYTIEAWPDDFASWRHDVSVKLAAGQGIELELIEGRALAGAALERASGDARAALEALVAQLDARESGAACAELLLCDAFATALARVPDRSRATRYDRVLFVVADRREAAVGAWYEMFARSQGTHPGAPSSLAQAARRLPDIRAMGFDVLYLAPIHPIGHAFRKGKNNSLEAGPDDPGSPWAIGNERGGHTALEPALGDLADFDRFVAEARRHRLEIALDYALQCSPDHPYIKEHPEWFSFRPDGSIKYAENPPKKYQDIVNFNWHGPHAGALWRELRDVVLFWIGHGIKIFRVDNPHTKPFAFWEWMIADVQQRHPDAIFLAEAFTRPKIMRRLAKLGFTQSYTYFTWRTFKGELSAYLDELAHGEMAEYFRPNFFANTPDILPPFLQSGGRPAFLIRLLLAATLSSSYGIYSGFELCENAALPGREEYADSEKYEIKVRDWEAPGNIKAEIAHLNRLRRENPALQDWRNVSFEQTGDDNVIFYRKSAGQNMLLVAVNLDPFEAHETELLIPRAELGVGNNEPLACEELLGGTRHLWHGPTVRVRFDPNYNPAAIYRVAGGMHVDYASPSD